MSEVLRLWWGCVAAGTAAEIWERRLDSIRPLFYSPTLASPKSRSKERRKHIRASHDMFSAYFGLSQQLESQDISLTSCVLHRELASGSWEAFSRLCMWEDEEEMVAIRLPASMKWAAENLFGRVHNVPVVSPMKLRKLWFKANQCSCWLLRIC